MQNGCVCLREHRQLACALSAAHPLPRRAEQLNMDDWDFTSPAKRLRSSAEEELQTPPSGASASGPASASPTGRGGNGSKGKSRGGQRPSTATGKRKGKADGGSSNVVDSDRAEALAVPRMCCSSLHSLSSNYRICQAVDAQLAFVPHHSTLLYMWFCRCLDSIGSRLLCWSVGLLTLSRLSFLSH